MSARCHPQFGSSGHMTPQGLSDCACLYFPLILPTSNKTSMLAQTFKLPSSPLTHTHADTLMAPGAAAGSSGVHQWFTHEGTTSGPDCLVSAISHTFTHAVALQSPWLMALLQRVEVHGRKRPNKDMSPGTVWEWWNEKKEEEGDKWVGGCKRRDKMDKGSVKERG